MGIPTDHFLTISHGLPHETFPTDHFIPRTNSLSFSTDHLMKTSYGPRHDNFSTDHLVYIFADQFLGGISVQVEAFVVLFFFLACVLCHRRLAPPLFQFFFPFSYSAGVARPASLSQRHRCACWVKRVLIPLPVSYNLWC